jgi:hypothetical protein
MKPADLCVNSAAGLLPFVEMVWDLDFTTEPNYEKLKHLLVCMVLEHEILPDQNFDWTPSTIVMTRRKQLAARIEEVDRHEAPPQGTVDEYEESKEQTVSFQIDAHTFVMKQNYERLATKG